MATGHYGGPQDYPDYWSADQQGAADQTEVQFKFRGVPGQQWKAYVAWLTNNDEALLDQDNELTQKPGDTIYPNAESSNPNTVAPPTKTWNGFVWSPGIGLIS